MAKPSHIAGFVALGLGGYLVYKAVQTVQFKAGVNAAGVQPQTWFALAVADVLRVVRGLPDLVVTALEDGTHMSGSLHYQGLAADLRTNDLTAAQQQDWFAALKAKLYPFGYDVVKESDHVHIEYDPKAGRSFTAGVEEFLSGIFSDIKKTVGA